MNEKSPARGVKDKNASEFRIPGLDALRGMAAVGVAIFHFHYFFDAGPNFLILQPIYNGAHFFVELFFVLSGFLLVQVYAHIRSYRELAVRRIARLFPLQWLSLLLVMIGQYCYAQVHGKPFIYEINDSYHFVLNLLLLQQVGLQDGFSFNGPSWSISAEWAINLVFFALLLRPRLLVPASIVLALLSVIILSAGAGDIARLTILFGFLDTGLLRVGFGFFVGVLAAKLVTRFCTPGRMSLSWDGITLICLTVFIGFLGSVEINHNLYAQIPAVGVLMPLLVIACSKGRLFSTVLSTRPLTWLGDISYAVYLLHFPIQILIFGFRKSLPVPLNSGEAILAYVLLLLAVSHLVFTYFERPSQKFIRARLRARTPAVPISEPYKAIPDDEVDAVVSGAAER
ncbi:MAG: acyltransferase [Methylobacter sp.]|uniref:acyltransferase family protein n=1 Tax=Methylobacter sp. TaxID=2051955 RepID=UPI00258EB724|nr:acyltransferase [Methylobacter sp.]MCL7420324.1 acyltransferase [Methylobacter sp.]